MKALEDQIRASRHNWVGQSQSPAGGGPAGGYSPRGGSIPSWAQRDQAQTQLSYTKVVAPIDGIVSVRVAHQGEVVQAGGPIVTVLDVDHLWVQASVEETYIDEIAFGQKLKVRLPSGNIIEGTVFFKGVESDYATQRDVSRTKRDVKAFTVKSLRSQSGAAPVCGHDCLRAVPPPPGEPRRFHF